MKNKCLIIVVLGLFSSLIYAGVFDIGGKEVVIPAPQGFSIVTHEMGSVYRLSMRMGDPKNDQLAYYISDSDVQIAMNGEMPPLKRTFLLKVNKQLKNMIIGSKDFTELKNKLKHQNKEMSESIKSQLPDLMKNISQGINKEFDVNIALRVSQMIPLEAHYEADNALSYSMYINYSVTKEGATEDLIVSSTCTFINVAGKVLFLYCYGPKGDLNWTRIASKSWAEQIVYSNSQPPARSSGGREMVWNKVFEKGFVGAVLGGGIVMIMWALSIFKKKKKDQQD